MTTQLFPGTLYMAAGLVKDPLYPSIVYLARFYPTVRIAAPLSYRGAWALTYMLIVLQTPILSTKALYPYTPLHL